MTQIGLLLSMKKLVIGAARLAALALVPLSLIAQPQKAEALLSFYIFDQGGNTKVKSIGSLTLPAVPNSSNPSGSCNAAGLDLDGEATNQSILLTTGSGNSCSTKTYLIDLVGLGSSFAGATAPTGSFSGALDSKYIGLFSDPGKVELQQDYSSGDSLDNEITFTTALATSLSGSGLIAEWKIMDGSSELDRIKVYLSAPPSAASAPAPLPIAGGALAFGWSRKLRRRAVKTAFSLRG